MERDSHQSIKRECEVTGCNKKTGKCRVFLSSFPVYLCDEHFDIPLVLLGSGIQTYKVEKGNLRFLSL